MAAVKRTLFKPPRPVSDTENQPATAEDVIAKAVRDEASARRQIQTIAISKLDAIMQLEARNRPSRNGEPASKSSRAEPPSPAPVVTDTPAGRSPVVAPPAQRRAFSSVALWPARRASVSAFRRFLLRSADVLAPELPALLDMPDERAAPLALRAVLVHAAAARAPHDLVRHCVAFAQLHASTPSTGLDEFSRRRLESQPVPPPRFFRPGKLVESTVRHHGDSVGQFVAAISAVVARTSRLCGTVPDADVDDLLRLMDCTAKYMPSCRGCAAFLEVRELPDLVKHSGYAVWFTSVLDSLLTRLIRGNPCDPAWPASVTRLSREWRQSFVSTSPGIVVVTHSGDDTALTRAGHLGTFLALHMCRCPDTEAQRNCRRRRAACAVELGYLLDRGAFVLDRRAALDSDSSVLGNFLLQLRAQGETVPDGIIEALTDTTTWALRVKQEEERLKGLA